MAIAPISPLQSASRNLSALDSILARGGSSFDTAISNAVQIGRDLANKQSQQERNFQQEQRRGVNLAQRRAENMSRDLKDARNFDESQRKFDLDFGLRREEAADRAIHRDLNLDISRANLRERQEENLFRRDQRERTMADQQEEDLRDQEALQRNESFIESYESMENPSTADRIQAQVAYKQLGHLGKAARLGYVTRVEEAKNQAEKELAVKHQKAFKDWDTRFGGSHGTAKEMQRALSMTWEEFGPKADSPTLEDKTDKEKAAILKMSRDFYDAVHYLNGKAEDRAAPGKDTSGLSDLQKPVPDDGRPEGLVLSGEALESLTSAEGPAAESEGVGGRDVGGRSENIVGSVTMDIPQPRDNSRTLDTSSLEEIRKKGISRKTLEDLPTRGDRVAAALGEDNAVVTNLGEKALEALEENDLSPHYVNIGGPGGPGMDALDRRKLQDKKRHNQSIKILKEHTEKIMAELMDESGIFYRKNNPSKDQKELYTRIYDKLALAYRAEQVVRRNSKSRKKVDEDATLNNLKKRFE